MTTSDVVDQPVGGAVLYVSSRVAPEAHRAFSDWCDSVHHFDTMRVDGFLSLRRFERLEVVGDEAEGFPLLTLYQVEDATAADPSGPSYTKHTESYSPAPPEVLDAITYERTVYARVAPAAAATQPVGRALVSVRSAAPDARGWLDGPVTTAVTDGPGVLGVSGYRVAGDAGGQLLLVDVEDEEAGRKVLAGLAGLERAAGATTLELFGQVFPAAGVLVRDRRFVEPGVSR
jgi:hypothetical protein